MSKLEQERERILGLLDDPRLWSGPVVHYHKYPNLKTLRARSPCSAAAAACFFEGSGVHSRAAINVHETVHALVMPLGRSLRFLEEGLSEALSCSGLRGPLGGWSVERAHHPETFKGLSVEALGSLYAAGASWVSFLLREREPSKFLKVYEQLGRDATTVQLETVFAQVYGSNVEELWAAAEREGAERPWCYNLR
jgi:hypothetical protein